MCRITKSLYLINYKKSEFFISIIVRSGELKINWLREYNLKQCNYGLAYKEV